MANVQTVASAAEQLAASIREIGGQVNQSTTVVGRAVAAGATREMTRRIGEVSAEAERTGQRCAKVRDDTAGLATLVDELKHSVILVVRSSMADVDRRQAAR